jgi:hypothetical protein
VRRFLALALALTLGGLAAIVARADTFNLADGSTLEGELVSATEKGAIVKQPDGKYSDRVAWEKFSQENLKAIAKNPKFSRYVQGLVIEDEPDQVKKKPAKPTVVAKPVETKLDRPANPALIGGFFGSAVGWFILLALYAANLWAAYEIALFRAQPIAVVCGAAALVPIIPQIVFLSMPTRLPKQDTLPGEEGAAGGETAAAMDPHLASSLKIAHQTETEAEKKGPIEPTIFKRGEFMFNRRFFESRFTNFFTVVRRDKDKGTVLIIKTSRREYTAQRITRITANDMHIEVAKGSGNEEIQVSFTEIAEVQLRQGGSH